MFKSRRTPAVLCAMVMLAAACGNSPSGDGAAPAPDTAPTTTAPATPAPIAAEPDTTEPGTTDEAPAPATTAPTAAEPDATEPDATEPDTTEPDTSDEAPAPAPEPDEPTEPTTTEPAEPVVEEPVDPYPQRHEYVALEGVPGVTDDEIRVAVIGTEKNNVLGNCILPCFATGIQAYFDYVNDAGGVYGRKLVIEELLDDELGFNQQRSLEVIDGRQQPGRVPGHPAPAGMGTLERRRDPHVHLEHPWRGLRQPERHLRELRDRLRRLHAEGSPLAGLAGRC